MHMAGCSPLEKRHVPSNAHGGRLPAGESPCAIQCAMRNEEWPGRRIVVSREVMREMRLTPIRRLRFGLERVVLPVQPERQSAPPGASHPA